MTHKGTCTCHHLQFLVLKRVCDSQRGPSQIPWCLDGLGPKGGKTISAYCKARSIFPYKNPIEVEQTKEGRKMIESLDLVIEGDSGLRYARALDIFEEARETQLTEAGKQRFYKANALPRTKRNNGVTSPQGLGTLPPCVTQYHQ